MSNPRLRAFMVAERAHLTERRRAINKLVQQAQVQIEALSLTIAGLSEEKSALVRREARINRLVEAIDHGQSDWTETED